MQEPRLYLTSHEAILKVVVDNVACRRLNSKNTHVDFLVCTPTFGFGLCDAQKIASVRSATRLLIQLAVLIDICAFCVEIRQFPHEWCIAIVAGLFECSSLDLSDNTDLVSCCHKALCMYRKSVDRDAGGRETIEMGFRRVYSIIVSISC